MNVYDINARTVHLIKGFLKQSFLLSQLSKKILLHIKDKIMKNIGDEINRDIKIHAMKNHRSI